MQSAERYDQQHLPGAIRDDPFIRLFLETVPSDVATSFTDSQLLQIKLQFGTRTQAKHVIDVRSVVGGGGWSYYFVLLLGRNRRDLSAIEQKLSRVSRFVFLLFGSIFLLALLVISLYLLKSFLGIDILPDFSFGLWHWLSS